MQWMTRTSWTCSTYLGDGFSGENNLESNGYLNYSRDSRVWWNICFGIIMMELDN